MHLNLAREMNGAQELTCTDGQGDTDRMPKSVAKVLINAVTGHVPRPLDLNVR